MLLCPRVFFPNATILENEKTLGMRLHEKEKWKIHTAKHQLITLTRSQFIELVKIILVNQQPLFLSWAMSFDLCWNVQSLTLGWPHVKTRGNLDHHAIRTERSEHVLHILIQAHVSYNDTAEHRLAKNHHDKQINCSHKIRQGTQETTCLPKISMLLPWGLTSKMAFFLIHVVSMTCFFSTVMYIHFLTLLS